MPIRERHYPPIPGLVARDRGDLPGRSLGEHVARRFTARALLPPSATPDHPSLVPTADGPLSRIMLTIPGYAVSETIMANAYRSLLMSLPATTKLVILVQAGVESAVREWLEASGRSGDTEVSTFDDTLNISVWAEDGYVICKDQTSNKTYFVEPYAFPRYADALVADFVCNFTDLHGTQAPLYFQGGNVLVGDDFFLIGADYPARSLEYIRSGVLAPSASGDPATFIADLYQRFLDRDRRMQVVGSTIAVPVEEQRKVTIDGDEWEEVVCAGNSEGTVQPLFHIDMFITLVGRNDNSQYRLLVGDPSLASGILGGPPPAHAMAPVFDNIARSLTTAGFEVIRNPLPLVYVDDPQAKLRRWYFATSNNALVQNRPTKEVWLPTYGYGAWEELQKTDDANRAIWERLGFEVHPLGDFHPFAENLGAVHCIKKYLSRD